MVKDTAKQISEHYASIYYYLHYKHEETITHQSIRLLQHIHFNGAQTIGEISNFLGISHNTASEHVKRLIKDELLLKERVVEDERKVLVKLTKKGREILVKNTQLDPNKLEDVLNKFNENQRESISKIFEMLAEESKCLY